jgi:phosphate transport system substrate-binding protein
VLVASGKTRRLTAAALLAGALSVIGAQVGADAAPATPSHAAVKAGAGTVPEKIGRPKAGKTTITMSGSTSVAPLAALLAQKYVKKCGHCVAFRLLQGGSDVGIQDVAHGRVTIGNSSRDPKPSDPGGLVFNSIAHDAICVITNKSNPVSGLDQNGVQQIFSGGVAHWNDVPGAHQGNDPIDLYVRTAASGTQDAFQKIFMNPYSVSGTAKQLSSNGLVQQRVKSDKDGIGYVSLFFAKGTHPVPYKGVACNLRNAKSLQYGGIRTFYMVTRGAASGPAGKWIHWIQHSKAAKKIIGTQWVPLH